MLVKLSTDVWRDVFEWLLPADRRKLAQLSTQDWQFSEVCQKWLHEWTKNVRLGPVLIIRPTKWIRKRGGRLARNVDGESARLQCWDYGEHSWMKQDETVVPIAELVEVEMPSNIVDFSEIQCSYLDTKVLQFARRMLLLSNHNNINVIVESKSNEKSLDSTRTALISHLLPILINVGQSIESMAFNQDAFPLLFTLRDHFPAQFFGLKQLEVDETLLFVEERELLHQWLSTRREDGKPRKLIVSGFDDVVEHFDLIYQRFLEATTPTSVVIYLCAQDYHLGDVFNFVFPVPATIQIGPIHNARTNEQLVLGRGFDFIFIGRCPAELDGLKWVDEMEVLEASEERRWIIIASPTLGQFEEAESDENDDEKEAEDEEEDVDKPGPSKKQKLA